jgi:hypothetical protein
LRNKGVNCNKKRMRIRLHSKRPKESKITLESLTVKSLKRRLRVARRKKKIAMINKERKYRPINLMKMTMIGPGMPTRRTKRSRKKVMQKLVMTS